MESVVDAGCIGRTHQGIDLIYVDPSNRGRFIGSPRQAGHKLASFTEEVGARMPTPQERRRLSLAEGTPVITVMRVAYDVDGRPVEMTDTVKSAPSYVLEYSFPAT